MLVYENKMQSFDESANEMLDITSGTVSGEENVKDSDENNENETEYPSSVICLTFCLFLSF